MTIQQFPQNKPLYEQVCQLIEAQIIEGEIQIGDKLPTENELAGMYKVSRTVIREAIKTLKEKGWVETHVAKGTFVVQNVAKGVETSLDAAVRMKPDDRFSNLIQVRLILEPEIAALAASSASPEDIRRMRQAVLLMDQALAENDVDAFLSGDFSFHMAMAESTGNHLIRLIVAPLVKLMRDIQRYHLANVSGGNQRSQKNHSRIMRAIEKNDPDTARQCMYEHIIQVRDDIQNAETIQNPA
jgi:GntR family transcriptional regulator, transcriptional repressor for pyruvate dehydrogenase complex